MEYRWRGCRHSVNIGDFLFTYIENVKCGEFSSRLLFITFHQPRLGFLLSAIGKCSERRRLDATAGLRLGQRQPFIRLISFLQ